MIAVQATFTLGGFSALDPRQLQREANRLGISTDWWDGKANSYRLPRGREPGRGYILLLHSSSKTLDIDSKSHILSIRLGTTTINLTNQCIVKSSAILGSQVLTDETAMLVEVADARVLGSLTTIEKGYNIPSPEGVLYDDSRNSGVDWTWTTMIQDIWGFLPSSVFGAAPAVPTGDLPATDPENFLFLGETAWEALNSVLDHIDHTVIRTRAGAFQFVSLSSADASATTLASSIGSLLDPGHSAEGDICSFPEKVRVYFRVRRGDYQSSTDEQVSTAADYRRVVSSHTVDTTTLSILGTGIATIAGTIKGIWSSLEADFDDAGTIQNSGDVNAHGLDLATTWLNTRLNAESPLDDVYSGLIGVDPGSTVAGVGWFDLGDGMKTHVVRHPRHMNSDGSPLVRAGSVGSLTSLAHESTAPPDIMRPQHPYPRRIEGVLQADLAVDGAGKTCRINKGLGDPPVWSADGTKDITVYSRTRGELNNHRITATFNEQVQKWLIDGDGFIRFGDVVTSSIPALAGSTPGTGTVDLFAFDNGTVSTTVEPNVTVYNFSANIVTVGTTVLLAKHTLDGRYIITDVLAGGGGPSYTWTARADSNPDEVIDDADVLDIAGAGGIATSIASTNGTKTITITGGAAGQLKYAICQTNWEVAATPLCTHVSVKDCVDCEGNTITGSAFDVILPETAFGDPNLTGDGIKGSSDVIAYRDADDGTKVCVSDYLDAKIFSVRLWTDTVANIPPGWKVMDGSANSIGNGGSGIDLVNMFVRGKTGTAAPDDTAAGSNTHDHGGATQSKVAGVTVGNHDVHTHDAVSTIFVEQGVADTEVWRGDTSAARTTSVDNPGISAHSVTDPGHTHDITASSTPGDLPEHKNLHWIERIDNSL